MVLRTLVSALFLLFVVSVAPAADAVFQFALPVKTTKGASTAFLWLPPEADSIRGVVVAGMTLAEREMVADARIRKTCAEERLALVFLKSGLASVDVPTVLGDLANVSGYRELAVAPLFFFGHSAGGPQAKAAAVKHRDRCFGVAFYRGGLPGGGPAVPPGVPVLLFVGQFDEFAGTMRTEAGRESWENARDAVVTFRTQDPAHLASLVVEWGAGHFAWSDRNAEYLALFLRGCARARIPDWRADTVAPVECKAIDPKTGWLTDATLRAPGDHKPAAWADFTGDRTRAAWHPDRALAEATVAYHRGFGKKDQFLKWNDPHWIDAGARHYFNRIDWVGDGQTFVVHPVHADKVPGPGADEKGPRWPLAGKPVGRSPVAIQVRPVGGPIVAVGADRFRIRYDALAPASDPGRVTFLAFSAGDDEYRATEQVGMLPRGFAGLTEGKTQKIDFPQPPDLKVNAGPLALKATSDSGLPVEFHVAHGPAVIEAGKLRLAEIPKRATFPIEIKVVAYQFGSGVEPRVATAAPVERTLKVERVEK